MTDPKPLPCPYCEGTGSARLDHVSASEGCIECRTCWASGPHKHTVTEAIEAWNTVARAVIVAAVIQSAHAKIKDLA